MKKLSGGSRCVPSRPLAQGWGCLSGCCRLRLVIARESFIQCNELYLFFPPQLRRRRSPGRRRRRQQRQRPQRRWWGRRRWRVTVGKCLVVHNLMMSSSANLLWFSRDHWNFFCRLAHPPDRSCSSPCSPVQSLPAHPRQHAHHRHRRCADSVAPTVRVSNQPASLSPSPSLSTSFSDSRFGCSCWAFRQHSAAPLGTWMPLTSAISDYTS